MTKIVAIAGASASGKSTLAEHLVRVLNERFGNNCAQVIGEDCYYRHRPDLSFAEREKVNYDHPESFEHSLLEQHLSQLKKEQSADIPQYSYSQHQRKNVCQTIECTPFLILEGLHVLGSSQLRDQFELSIFVDTPMDICLMRRLIRDVESRGRTTASVLDQYQKTVRPMYYEFIEPSKEHADFIVDGTATSQQLLEKVLSNSLFLNA